MINTIFILDEYYKTKKVLTVDGVNTFFDDLYTMDLSTGVESYEFSTNIVDIDESNYIMFYYHEQYKLFQITEIEQEHSEGGIITYCYGESASLELLNNAVRVFSGEFNCISFFEHILNGTGWSIGRYSSSLADKVMTIDVNRTTQVWSCIQDHMAIFGYELNTRVIYENGHLKHKLIDIFIEGELGNKTYKRFEYGRNVEGIIKKKDLYEWCTALIIETDAENMLDVSYNSDGYVKEKGSDVVLAIKENEEYNLGRNYIYASYEDNSPSGQEVVENAVAELIRRATPRFDYECDTILTYKEFEDISIGDTVHVIDHTFNPMITLEARVGKLELSFTDRNNCKCILTNYKEIKSGLDITLTGSIKDIVDTYFPVTSDGIADGAITNGKIETTYYQEITADIVSAGKVVAEELIAERAIIVDAQIQNLEAEDARIENLTTANLNAINANVQNLNAVNANINTLTADVADIQTLVNGNLTSDNIQSLNLTAANTTIENALIKNAMIDSISANKVNTGTLNTNNVNIQSEDGSMLLQGNLQQFKDKNGNVRIQIGKDASGDFTFVLYDENGTGQLINAQGIQSSDAIADGLIVNAHVDDNANIHGSKLDIDSVITTINEDGSETLKGSKIKLDDTNQTLDVAFNSMTNKVNNNTNALNTQSTQIGVQQGQINTLITNTTIQNTDGTTTQLKDAYNSTKATVDSLVTKIGSLETNYGVTLKEASVQYYLSTSLTSLSDGSWSDTAPAWTSGKYMWQRMKYKYTDGTVTYGSAACVAGAKGDTGDKGQSLVSSVPQYYLSTSNTSQTGGSWVETMPALADNKYLWLRYKLTWANPTATTYTTPVLEQVAESIKVVSSKQATLEQSLEGFKTTVSNTYQTKSDMSNYSTTSQMNSAISQSASAITSSVSSTYATKNELSGQVNTLNNSISTVSQTANKINWLVKSGTSESNMTLTDKTYSLISNNISLSANKIDLHGYVTANGGFSIDTSGSMTAKNGTFSGTIETDKIMKAYGAVYAGTELWGGFTRNASGNFESLNTFKVHATNALLLEGNPIYLSSVNGEVRVGDSSSYDNLRARELYAQEIIYSNTYRARTGSTMYTHNICIEPGSGFVEFGSGLGVVRVAEENHLYLQCGSTAGNTSTEVRCTCYKNPSTYTNLRAHNVCAQNAVYANGVNVSSDKERKRDIELYDTDALSEICSTPVYAYHLDTDLDEEMKRIGIIMQEAPVDAVDISGKGVDLYQMTTMLWKAVQQQQELINGLEQRIKDLESNS